MEITSPDIRRVQQVEIGSLFVLQHPRKATAICFKAAFNLDPEDADEAHRVIPLWWPGEPDSVGLPIYVSALGGDAVVLEGARLEINPLSARQPSGSITAVYGRGTDLFFPLRHNGRLGGLVNVATGEILDSTSGHYVAFDEWYVTINDEGRHRKRILSVADMSRE